MVSVAASVLGLQGSVFSVSSVASETSPGTPLLLKWTPVMLDPGIPPPKKKVASFQRNHLFRESHLQIRLQAEVLGTGAPTYDFRGNILQPIMVPTLLTLQIRMLRPERLSKLPEFPQLVSVEPGTEADLETRMLLPPPPYWVLSLSPVPSRCHLTSSGLGFHSPMAPPPPLVSGYPDSVCRSTYTATCCSSVWTIE